MSSVALPPRLELLLDCMSYWHPTTTRKCELQDGFDLERFLRDKTYHDVTPVVYRNLGEMDSVGPPRPAIDQIANRLLMLIAHSLRMTGKLQILLHTLEAVSVPAIPL